MTPLCCRLAWLILIVLCQAGGIWGQQKVWKEYTIDEGLPGSNVFSILQAKNKYLWFTSNRGLFWFDGIQFRVPVDTSRFQNTEAFSPSADSLGRIWFTRLDNSVWFVEHDTIRPWKFNDLLLREAGRTPVNNQLSFDHDGTLWVSLGGIGFIGVDKHGGIDTFQIKEGEGYIIKSHISEASLLYYYKNPSDRRAAPRQQLTISELKKGSLVPLYSYSRPDRPYGNYFNAWYFDDRQIVLNAGGNIVVIRDGKIVTEFITDIPDPRICVSSYGDWYVGSMQGSDPGLFHYESLDHFQSGNGEKILDGYKIHSILEDHEGGIWVTTQEGPLLYCKNPNIDIFDVSSGFSSNEILRIAHDDEFVYAGVGSLDIFRVQPKDGKVEKVVRPDLFRTWESMFFEKQRSRLWVSSSLAYLENNKWKKLSAFSPFFQMTQEVNVKKMSLSPNGTSLWMSSTFGFYNLNLDNLRTTPLGITENMTAPIRTFAVEEDIHGNIWVATIKGLRIWENEEYRMPAFNHPSLKYQARDLTQLPNASLVIALAGAGVLIYDTNRVVTHIDMNKGLSSNFITKVNSTREGEILACSDAGLNRLFQQPSGAWEVQVISATHGLPSNLVHDVIAMEDKLWIATAKGLVRTIVPDRGEMPELIIIQYMADSVDLMNRSSAILPYNANTISIRYETVHFRAEGNIQYRYRLLPGGGEFIVTHLQHVTIPNLAPGSYTLELQAGLDGIWTESIIRNFEIKPPWWKSVWFIMVCIISVAVASYQFYAHRVRQLKKSSAQVAKIKDLELAALRAQMNPHFIFNCLSSVQQFITQHKPEEANRFLSRFAKLIRLALHSSVDGKHSLADEINMLDHYLALEQLRFKDKFNYVIECDDTIDKESIYIPPMLIQPFAENAVIHGIGGKESGGLINIRFSVQDQKLQVSVSDNGPGISEQSTENAKSHKSLGLSLTSKRLTLLSENGTAHTHQNIMDQAGRITGSAVVIQLPMSLA